MEDYKEVEKFKAGTTVIVNKVISPVMVVAEEIYETNEMTGKAMFKGLKCFWFDNNNSYQEAIFNRNDLQKS